MPNKPKSKPWQGKGIYVRRAKNKKHEAEAETGISVRDRALGGGSHDGKPIWAHGISPFQDKHLDYNLYYATGEKRIIIEEPKLTDESHPSGLVGLNRDGLAAIRGTWKKAKKKHQLKVQPINTNYDAGE